MKKELINSTVKVLRLSALLFLILISCNKDEQGIPEITTKSTRNQSHPGTPFTAYYENVDPDKKSILFGIITDSHINSANCQYYNNDHMKSNKKVIDDINWDIAHWAKDENFIVHLGDAVDAENVQNIVAFRQLYEEDYHGLDGGSIAGCGDDN